MTTRRTGIRSVAALRGRSVSIGAPGSATGILARRVLAAAGLDIDRDLRSRRSLGASEANTAILRGEADTSFKVAGLPSPAIADLAARPGTELVLVDQVEPHGVLAQPHGPVYVPDLVAAGTYRGQESGNRQISVLMMLAVHAVAPGALVELLLGVA